MYSTWSFTGEKIAIRLKIKYFKSILNQDVEWFDQINPNELASKVIDETKDIADAVGEKVPRFVMTLSLCISGFALAYFKGWQMALVVTAALPVIAGTGMIFMT